MSPVNRCDDSCASEAILGIDAAWTDTQPSGVALITGSDGGWRSVAIAPSYEAFVGMSDGKPMDWSSRPKGSRPDPSKLIEAVNRLSPGAHLSVVAVDMPMAIVPIRGRREADNEVSRKFGKYKCAVHSPNEKRPGPTGSKLTAGFASQGYRLSTHEMCFAPGAQHLIEVYPHSALVALFRAEERLKYKLSRERKYWPDDSRQERRQNLIAVLNRIADRLRGVIADIKLPVIHAGSRIWEIKAFEDALDAIVCAWVGMKYSEGQADAFGDETAAIWIPPLVTNDKSGSQN